MNEEAQANLEITDEQWLADWNKENGPWRGFGMDKDEGRTGNCKDTELYDALGVAPDAS